VGGERTIILKDNEKENKKTAKYRLVHSEIDTRDEREREKG
jgi:hypothetical protein